MRGVFVVSWEECGEERVSCRMEEALKEKACFDHCPWYAVDELYTQSYFRASCIR